MVSNRTCVLDITRNYLWCGFSPEKIGNVEQSVIVIIPRSTLGSSCSGSIRRFK